MEKVLSDVRILPLSALRLHEMTQRELTNRIKGMIRASRTARSPIIVERKSRVVLDGMHRVEAFLELGYRNILCQLVDYDAPGLLVGAWFPTFDAREPMQEVAKLAETKPVALATGMRMLKTSKAAFLLAYSEKGRRKFALVAPSARRFSTEGLVRAQYSLIRKLSARHAMSYVPDYEWEEHKGAILLRRSFSKGEVLAMARKGVLFPPKATRPPGGWRISS